MKGIKLTMKEQEKYEVIKALVDNNGNKDRAAKKLDCSRRHVNRMIQGYKKEGKAYFSHGNKGRKPATTISEETRIEIVRLYREKYNGANFAHFTELLAQNEGIVVSVVSVTKFLEAENIYSPRITKKKKRRIKKELQSKMKEASSKKEAEDIEKNLVAIEEAHPTRPRSTYFGELIQMDASSFEWIPGEIWHLHVAIDDSTGSIVGGWFATQETLDGYYHVLHQILTNHGIPYSILTDCRSVFIYKRLDSPSVDKDTCTQFAYACKQLGVELKTTSVAQAKGRVERLNQTLQSRLPVEMKLENVTDIESANEFLKSYIQKFNTRFSLQLNNTKSVFENQLKDEETDLILSVLCERTVDSGHCIKHSNKYYRMLDKNGRQVYYARGTKVMFIKSYYGNNYCCVNNKDVYALEEIPERQAKSVNFDADYKEPEPRVISIPPMCSYWNRDSFKAFLKQQKHHAQDENSSIA